MHHFGTYTVWEKVIEMEALCGHKAMKLVTWQMIILISITGALKWNAFISPYLQAHVFLFLISLKKPFFSSDLGPNKNSGNQLRVLLQPTPALLFTLVESTSKETVKWRKTEFTIRTEQKGGGRGVERKKKPVFMALPASNKNRLCVGKGFRAWSLCVEPTPSCRKAGNSKAVQ